MALPLAGEGSPRRDEAAWDLAGELDEALRGRAELSLRAFDEVLHPAGLRVAAQGPASNLAGALSALPPAQESDPLLILSDGQVEVGEPGGDLERRPVFAVLLGDSMPPDDLRLEGLDAPPLLQKGERGSLRLRLEASGDAAREGRLLLREEGREILSRDWVLPEGRRELSLELPLLFDEPGRKILELELQPRGADEVAGNNVRSFSLRVLDETLRVLLLAGRPDEDLSFLLASLRGEASLELSLVLAAEGGRLRHAESGRDWLPQEGPYQALVLHSLPTAAPPDLEELLAPAGGLLLLPGALDGGDWPSNWDLDEFMARGSLAEVAGYAWGPGAGRDEMLRGLPSRGPSLSALPPLEALRWVRLPAGSRVLLRAGGEALLALREQGSGRQAFWTGTGLHRWALHDDRGGPFLADLMGGLLRWLARPRAPHRIQLPGEGASLPAGRRGELRARLFGPDFQPDEAGALHWRLRAGEEQLASGAFEGPREAGDDYRSPLPALPEGRLVLELEAESSTGETLRRETELILLPDWEEGRRRESNPAALRWLAEIGGGRLFTSTDAEAILEALPLHERAEARAWTLRVWQHPLFFLLFLILLALEWGLRKRFGMV